MGSVAATLTVTLYAWNGVVVGSFPITVAAKGWVQENAPYANRYGRTDTAGWALITVNSGSGVIVYGSVVDKHSNDGTTIPMKR